MLLDSIKEASDKAQVVIVPNGETSDGFKLVVLDESILNKHAFVFGPTFRELDHSSFGNNEVDELRRLWSPLSVTVLHHPHILNTVTPPSP